MQNATAILSTNQPSTNRRPIVDQSTRVHNCAYRTLQGRWLRRPSAMSQRQQRRRHNLSMHNFSQQLLTSLGLVQVLDCGAQVVDDIACQL